MNNKEIENVCHKLESDIGVLENYLKKSPPVEYEHCFESELLKDLYSAIYILRQQLIDGWIPVSEKMPEFDQNCLVTTDNGEIFTSRFYGYGEECQGFREYPEGVWEIDQCELEVVAWQPLPEPYKG